MRHLAAVLSIALCACGTSGAGLGRGDDSKADGTLTPPEETPVLATNYGVVLSSEMTACATEPNATECKDGERKTIKATIRGLATVTQGDDSVDVSISACRINLDWDGEAYDDTKYFNDTDTIQHLGELAHLSGRFVDSDSGPVLQSGLSALLLGVEFENPIEEDMPTSHRDARALDQDGDGKAGVSLDAPLGRVFVGTRVVFDLPLQMAAADDGSIVGSLEVGGFDFSVYDDSIPFVNAGKKADEALSKIMMVSQSHNVTMIPDYVDCERVLSEL